MSFVNNIEGIKRSIMESVGVPKAVLQGQDTVDADAMAFQQMTKRFQKFEDRLESQPLAPIIRVPSNVFDGTLKTMGRLMQAVENLAPGTIVQDEQGFPLGRMTGVKEFRVDDRFAFQIENGFYATPAPDWTNISTNSQSTDKPTMEDLLKTMESMSKTSRDYFAKLANPMMVIEPQMQQIQFQFASNKRDRDGDILDPNGMLLSETLRRAVEDDEAKRIKAESMRDIEEMITKKEVAERITGTGSNSPQGFFGSGYSPPMDYGAVGSGKLGAFQFSKPQVWPSGAIQFIPMIAADNKSATEYAEFLAWKQQQEAVKKEESKKPKPVRLIVLQEDLDEMARQKEKK